MPYFYSVLRLRERKRERNREREKGIEQRETKTPLPHSWSCLGSVLSEKAPEEILYFVNEKVFNVKVLGPEVAHPVEHMGCLQAQHSGLKLLATACKGKLQEWSNSEAGISPLCLSLSLLL